MNLKRLIALIIIYPGFLFAQQKPAPKKAKTVVKEMPSASREMAGEFSLDLTANGFADSTVAVIVHPSNQQFRGPFGYLKKGKVVLQGHLPQPDLYLLVLTDGKNPANDQYFNAFLDNEPAAVEVKKNDPSMRIARGKTLQAFGSLISTFGNDFDGLTKIGQQKQQFAAAGQSVAGLDSQYAIIRQGIKTKLPLFLNAYGSGPVAAYLLYTVKPLLSITETDSLMHLLQPSSLASVYGAELSRGIAVEKVTGEGQPAPNFTQNDTIGKPISLSDFKGKYVLIDFWASWCGPCRQENPNVVNAYNNFRDKNFTVLGVSLDQDKSRWLKAIKDDNLTWTHVSDLQSWQNAAARQYMVQSIPQNFLIDPTGKIIAKNLRGGVLQSYLQQTLK